MVEAVADGKSAGTAGSALGGTGLPILAFDRRGGGCGSVVLRASCGLAASARLLLPMIDGSCELTTESRNACASSARSRSKSISSVGVLGLATEEGAAMPVTHRDSAAERRSARCRSTSSLSVIAVGEELEPTGS